MDAPDDANRRRWLVAAGVGGAGVLGAIWATFVFGTPAPPPATDMKAVLPGLARGATIVVRVESDPPGADVLLDGEVTAKTPGDLLLDRGDAPVDLLFRLSGHVPAVARVVPDRDQRVRPVLRPPELPARPGPH